MADPQGQGQSAGDNKPVRIPLVTDLANRSESPTVDARLVNCYAERLGQDETHIYKRPGMLRNFQPTGGAAVGRGIFNWNNQTYTIFNGSLYSNAVLIGSVANSGFYTFSSILGSVPALFFQNGTNYYSYSPSGGLQSITPGSFTSSVPGCGYLDGTMYVMDAGGNIWGSNLNNVSTGNWVATNVIVAQSEPCPATILAKQLVYIIAFKEFSIEMFFDTGNATGSPLGPVPGQKLNYGIRHQGSLAQIAGVLLWLDLATTGGMSVRVMDQLTAQPCSTPQVERLIQLADFNGFLQPASLVYSWTARIDGHMFYVLTIEGLNLSLVYDLSQKVWYQWTSPAGGYLPIVGSTFQGGQTLVQHESNGWVYSLSTQTAMDDNVIIPSDIYTPPFDGGVYRRKVIDKMRVLGDKYTGNVLQVRVSDDDYVSWSQPRMVDMGIDDPMLLQCGTFRRRAWHLHHASNVPGRIVRALEPEIELGDL